MHFPFKVPGQSTPPRFSVSFWSETNLALTHFQSLSEMHKHGNLAKEYRIVCSALLKGRETSVKAVKLCKSLVNAPLCERQGKPTFVSPKHPGIHLVQWGFFVNHPLA